VVDGSRVPEEVVPILVRESEPPADRPIVAVDERQSLAALLSVGPSDALWERYDGDRNTGARVLVDQSENVPDRVSITESKSAASVLPLLRGRGAYRGQRLPLLAD
jgi:hypothetical protein